MKLPSKLTRFHPAVATGLAALVLLAPSLVLGTMASHSSPQNLIWAQQFADQFRAGILYPRWLPDSFDGLGAPVFYFYPPLAFWLDALLSLVTFDAVPVSYRLSIVWALLLWGSGLAMYAWLRGEGPGQAVALVGALAYMAAPYHLLDHYVRGALAEFAAYAVLPLIMLAIGQIARRQPPILAPALLAGSYAALLLSHLPSALLISVTAIPAYVLYRAWRLGDGKAAIGVLVRCALGGMLGLGLAALYLVPALELQDAVSFEQLWTPGYRVETWFLLTPGRWIRPIDMMLIVVSIAAASFFASLGVLAAARGEGHSRRPEAIFWALLCLAALLVMSGLVPWFWTLVPMVWKVQFTWRVLIIVEFAAITALCLLAWPLKGRVARLVLLAAVAAAAPGIGMMGGGIKGSIVAALEGDDTPPLDVKEYLPAGYPHRANAAYDDLRLDAMKRVPPAACVPAARVCRLTAEPHGEARIEIESEAPTTAVTVRRFVFPAWRLDPAVTLAASEPLRLVTFVAPAGAHSYRLHRAPLAQEKIGGALSALSLLLLIGWTAWERRRATAADRART